nr:uncharacterized protein LOC123771864 isoform X1 [Procambarus clarkii]XP_045620544.1 uncharacterized protein LOC123771864 isoform X1 [Procambarus clarkii]XP_045620545.1 uncharacterized protein LOC123771864 isoform X1 [Procambarus clarkii]XP_045620546.1 uncharacterized protein LOC123771864 isoform X1 [Procambarus clarkii]
MPHVDNLINEIRSAQGSGGGTMGSKVSAHSSPPAAPPAASEKVQPSAPKTEPPLATAPSRVVGKGSLPKLVMNSPAEQQSIIWRFLGSKTTTKEAGSRDIFDTPFSPDAQQQIINKATKDQDGLRKGCGDKWKLPTDHDSTGVTNDDSTDSLGTSTDALYCPSSKTDSPFNKKINFAKGSSAASVLTEDLCRKLKAMKQDDEEGDKTKEVVKSTEEQGRGEAEEGEEGGSAGVTKKRTCRTWAFWLLILLVIPLITVVVFILPRAYYSGHLSADNETETNGTQVNFITYMSKLGYGKLKKADRDSVVQTVSKITEIFTVIEDQSSMSDQTAGGSESASSDKATTDVVYVSEEQQQQQEQQLLQVSLKPTTEDYSLIQEASDMMILSSEAHATISEMQSSPSQSSLASTSPVSTSPVSTSPVSTSPPPGSPPQDKTPINSDQISPTILRAVFDSLFKSRRGEDVVLPEFIAMYRNMMVFFGSFGGFANIQTQMLDNRIQNLELYTKRREGLQYETLRSMIHYEDTSGKIGSTYPFSGTILFTCLHRHLQFLALSLTNIVHLQPQQPLLEAFKPAYETVLSWHHTWFVEQFYKVGMALLPLKEEAIRRLKVTQGEDVSNDVLAASIRLVVNEVDKLTNLSQDILTRTDALKKIPEEVIT